MKKLVLITSMALLALCASAQSEIVGLWTTIDDILNEPVSIVKIYKATNGKYYGRVEEIVLKGYEDMKCEKCKDELKNTPVKGLIIIRDMEYIDGKLCNGSVLDPNNGKTYYGKIWYDSKKERLILRGSLDKRGILGRNQDWIRKK